MPVQKKEIAAAVTVEQYARMEERVLALEAELKRLQGLMAEEKERGLEKAVSNQEELAKL